MTIESFRTEAAGTEYKDRLDSLYGTVSTNARGIPHRQAFDERPLNLGLFLPTMSGGGGGMFVSTLLSDAEPTFAYNARCARTADRVGFDFVFPVARWAGDGGSTHYNDYSLETIALTTGLGAVTERIMIFTTWHVLYGFHPLHVAKIGGTIDHIMQGRWGINLVAGRKPKEVNQFGLGMMDSEERYAALDEFVDAVKRLWTSDTPIDLDGRYYRGTAAQCLPKPPQRPYPLLINAGQSEPGIEFTTRECDAAFIHGGKDNDLDELAAVIGRFRERAKQHGRTVKLVLPVIFMCAETEREAHRMRERIVDTADMAAARSILDGYKTGTTTTAPTRDKIETIVFGIGGYKLNTSYDRALERLVMLHEMGVDAFQFIFWDPIEGMELIGERYMPEFERLGLR